MRSAKRILGSLVVLAVAGYLAFEAGPFTGMKESRDAATSFCSRVTAGLPANTALALARENVAERMLHIEVDEMFVSFRGGCHCRVGFKGGKAFKPAVFCAN